MVGVRRFFFLPRLVASRTSAEEFHSVKKTCWPRASSHFCSSLIWVLFPEPSIPSTTMSRPFRRALLFPDGILTPGFYGQEFHYNRFSRP